MLNSTDRVIAFRIPSNIIADKKHGHRSLERFALRMFHTSVEQIIILVFLESFSIMEGSHIHTYTCADGRGQEDQPPRPCLSQQLMKDGGMITAISIAGTGAILTALITNL